MMRKGTLSLVICLLSFASSQNVTISPSQLTVEIFPGGLPKLLEFAEKLEQTVQEHLKNDGGFKAAVLYFQDKEWRGLVEAALQKPEFKKFADVAEKFGMNVTKLIVELGNYIKTLKVVPATVTSKPNLESFFAGVKDLLPFADLNALTKIAGDPHLKELRIELNTAEYKKMIAEDLHNLPELVKMREILKGMNFDVEPYLALIYSILGWFR